MNPRQLGRLLRTVLQLRPRQITAQIRHTLTGGVAPMKWAAAAPVRVLKQGHAEFLPAPEHARYDGWRSLELIGRRVNFRDGIDWDHPGEGPLWAFHLHQFDYARDPGLSAAARLDLIDDWIANCRGGIGWSPHPISLRLLSWGKLLLTPGALQLADDEAEWIHLSMAEQAETLARNLEVRLQANHLFSNLIGVVFAGLLFEGREADRWLSHEAALRREIEMQILPDGSHIEASPMYHGLLLENLLDVLNLARVLPARTPAPLLAALEDATARMLGAHRVWQHPDGEIALLGDSAFAIAHPPEWLEAYAADLGITARGPAEPGVLADAGVVRIDCGSFRLIAKAAQPAPAYQPGHAHCDALSFELSVKDERVVTDTGVSEYIPGPLREASRRTASHATLEVAGEEQSEIWASHRIGGRPNVQIERAVADQELLASCTGWRSHGFRHERHFEVQGGSVVIRDRLHGGPGPVRLILPLAPGLVPRLARQRALSPQGQEAWELLTLLRCGLELRIELPTGFRWRLGSSPYFPRFGSNVERACLTGQSDAFREGTWRFSLRRSGSAGRSRRSTEGAKARSSSRRSPRGRRS